MDILISDAYIPIRSGLAKGYVYITEGKISEIGEGEPPPDLVPSQLCYPVGGGVVLRGLSSPLTSLLTFWARGLMPLNITYNKALDMTHTLADYEKVLIASSALDYMLGKGFTFLGIILEQPKIAKKLEETFDIDLVWINISEQRGFELSYPVVEAGRVPSSPIKRLIIEETGPVAAAWSDGSISYCSNEPKPLTSNDSVCVSTGLNTVFPKWLENYYDRDVRYLSDMTSNNVYRQLSGKRLSLELNRGDPANLVVIDPDSPQVLGLTLIEIAKLFYLGFLSSSAIELVISNGYVVKERGESLLMDTRMFKQGARLMREIRKRAIG